MPNKIDPMAMEWSWVRPRLNPVANFSIWWVHFIRSALVRLRDKQNASLKRIVVFFLQGINRRIVQFCQQRSIVVTMKSPDATAFCYPVCDMYWERAGLENAEYEREILEFLYDCKSIPYAFLDCGANFGYWSAIASSPTMQWKQTIAIEASPTSAKTLRKTAIRNQNRFLILERAISAKDNETIKFEHSLDHAGSQIRDTQATIIPKHSREYAVETISIDGLVAHYVGAQKPVIVKLDVEGHEVQALKGAQGLKTRDALLIYEDHGNDPTNAITRTLLSSGWDVYWPTLYNDGSLAFHQIHSAESLTKLKTNAHKGYNIFATPKENMGSLAKSLQTSTKRNVRDSL